MKIKIIKCENGNFTGRDGSEIEGFWITATKIQNGARLRFWDRNEQEEGKETDLPIIAEEMSNGKFNYKIER